MLTNKVKKILDGTLKQADSLIPSLTEDELCDLKERDNRKGVETRVEVELAKRESEDAVETQPQAEQSSDEYWFVFIGDQDGDGPQDMGAYGYEMSKNNGAVQVSTQRAIRKLSNNWHFKRVTS